MSQGLQPTPLHESVDFRELLSTSLLSSAPYSVSYLGSSPDTLTSYPDTLTDWTSRPTQTGHPPQTRPPEPDLPVGQDRFGYLYPTVGYCGIQFGLLDTDGDTQNRRFSSYIRFHYPPKMQVLSFFGFQCISDTPIFSVFQTTEKCRFFVFLG